MASYGVLLALCGFRYHGPHALLGIAPRITPDDFKAPFTSAEGWGTLAQRRTGREQTDSVTVKWGRLRLRTLAVELPKDARLSETSVTLGGRKLEARTVQEGVSVSIELTSEAVIGSNEALNVTLKF
jgi:hypothetical protein